MLSQHINTETKTPLVTKLLLQLQYLLINIYTETKSKILYKRNKASVMPTKVFYLFLCRQAMPTMHNFCNYTSTC